MAYYQPQDKYFKKAKEEGYRARSVFKLEEIQNALHLAKPTDKILDLGAAPGSFMQYLSKIIGDKGLLIGIDLQTIKPINKPNVKSYTGDIFDDKLYIKILKENGVDKFDLITSDLAPSTSGIQFLDAGRSFQLNEQVLKVAEKYLKTGGHVLLKAFPGADHSQLVTLVKNSFNRLKVFKPHAVRKTSREVYLVGMGKKA